MFHKRINIYSEFDQNSIYNKYFQEFYLNYSFVLDYTTKNIFLKEVSIIEMDSFLSPSFSNHP